MKIITKISLLLILIISVSSCDNLDELTEFDIDGNLSTTFTVSETDDSEGMPVTFSEQSSVDLASDVDIQTNLDFIQSVTVNAISYEISNYTGVDNATLTEGTFTFGNTTVSIDSINLQESDNNNTVYTIEDPSVINAIANALANETSISASVNGTVSATPISFDINVELDVTTTVDLL